MTTTTLEDIAGTIRSVAAVAGPSVVGIDGGGSGFVIGENLVATNAHNVGRGEITVRFGDGRHEHATLRGVDVDGDLAVLSAPTGDAPPVAWSTSEADLGDVVVALANPGGRGLRVTTGTVSSVARAFRGPRGRRIAGTIEHTAPLARGSSGGPVLDRDGHVVAINTNRLRDGFYLAVPATAAVQQRLVTLGDGVSPEPRRLGAAIVPPPAAARLRTAAGLPTLDGLLIRAVEDDSPAALAGLQQGDVLVRADGSPLSSVDDLYEVLARGGETLELHVVRGVEERDVQVRFPTPDANTGGS